MKTTKFLAAIIGCLFLYGWAVQKINDIKKTAWLTGTWEIKSSRGSIFETWDKVDDNAFSGKSYRIKEKDTIVFENIQLLQEQNRLVYIPTVKNQNAGLPVRFVSTTISEKELVFENLQHDFPQIISYKKINADSLVAEISGIKNGQERKQVFPMKRVK